MHPPVPTGWHKLRRLLHQAFQYIPIHGSRTPLTFTQDQRVFHPVDPYHIDLGLFRPGAADLIRKKGKAILPGGAQHPFLADLFPGMRANKIEQVVLDLRQGRVLHAHRQLCLAVG
jgi:hypothetical protein